MHMLSRRSELLPKACVTLEHLLSVSEVDRTGFSYKLVSHCFCKGIFGIHTFSGIIPGISGILLIWTYARKREV